MMIRQPPRETGQPRILKVRLPTDMHLRLHSLKILTGKSISEAVEEALGEYFQTIQGDRTGAAAAAPEAVA